MKQKRIRFFSLLLSLTLLFLCILSGCQSVEDKIREAFTLNMTETALRTGETAQLTVNDGLEGKYPYTATWISENPSVAAVNSEGLVIAVTEGSTIINTSVVVSASSDVTLQLTCLVTVSKNDTALTGVSFSESIYTVALGQTLDLREDVVFSPNNAANKNLTWTSATPTVATVENGVVTPVAEGVTNISITSEDGQFRAECVVRVSTSQVPATGLEISKTSLTMKIGETSVLSASVLPASATGYTVAWTSSNTDIVSVASGTLTAKRSGKVTVTATIRDSQNTYTAVCAVTVTEEVIEIPATRATLSPARIDIVLGETGPWSFTPTVIPANTTQTGSWSCDSDIIKIDKTSGLITLVGDIGESSSVPIIVTYTIGSVSAKAVVFVSRPKVTMTLNQSSLTLQDSGLNTTATLSAVFSDPSVNTNVTWSSSKPSVATVDENGMVTAVAPGTATITATSVTDSSLSASCTVTVEKSPYIILTVGETWPLDLQGITDPEWSYPPSYVAISGDNVLTALKITNAPIEITAISKSDNSKKITYSLIIQEGTDDISLSMKCGSELKVETTLIGVSKWEILSNTADASFNKNTGVLKAGDKAGMVELLATSPSGATQKITVAVTQEELSFSLTAEKKSYQPGDTVRLTLNANRSTEGTLVWAVTPVGAAVLTGGEPAAIQGTEVKVSFVLSGSLEPETSVTFVVNVMADGTVLATETITVAIGK